MMLPRENRRLRPALAALQRLLSRFDDAGLIIGGVAVGLLSTLRFTAGADVLLLVSPPRRISSS